MRGHHQPFLRPFLQLEPLLVGRTRAPLPLPLRGRTSLVGVGVPPPLQQAERLGQVEAEVAADSNCNLNLNLNRNRNGRRSLWATSRATRWGMRRWGECGSGPAGLGMTWMGLGARRAFASRSEEGEEGEEEEDVARKPRSAGKRPRLTEQERGMLWLWAERLRGMSNMAHQLEHDERPLLAQEVKERMFELHCSDPKHWDVARLSREFGLSKARVTAYLLFQQMRAEATAHGVMLNDDITRAMEDQFGVVDRYADKIILPKEVANTHSSSNVPIEEDADEEAYYQLARKIRRDRIKYKPMERMPEQPPPDQEHQLKIKILYEPTTKINYPAGWVLQDADDEKAFLGRKLKIDDAKRLTWVFEPDGVIRTPTWSERRALQRPKIHKRPEEKWEYSILDRVNAKDLERYHRLVVDTPNLYLTADEMMALGMPEPPADLKEVLDAREYALLQKKLAAQKVELEGEDEASIGAEGTPDVAPETGEGSAQPEATTTTPASQ